MREPPGGLGGLVVLISLMLLTIGCSSADTGPKVYTRQATDSDTPFGGGFPPDRRPGGDPLAAASRRNEVRLDWRGDNGAPETRVNTGGDTRTQTGAAPPPPSAPPAPGLAPPGRQN
jgi:hypothetical protein